RFAVLLGLSYVFLNFLGANITRFMNGFWGILTTPLLTAGNTKITTITIILTIPIFYLASWIARLAKRFIDSSILSKLSMQDETKYTISILLRNGVLLITILVGLSFVGLDLSTLTILFGVLGIGVGFGLQGFVSDLAAGFVLIFERPLKDGDRIRVDGIEGEVVRIRLRSTIINTLLNETIIVPNSRLVQNSIHNNSYRDNRIIVANRVQVHYQTDLLEAREAMLGVNERNPYSIAEPAPEVRVIEFQDSGILIELRTWIKSATQKYQAMAWINLEIWSRFRDAGIQIPYPQMDLYIKEIPIAGDRT
ncbi:MAG TPA: mechanosensitive ion channel domain-containing protein, partial [Spirochaetia bacterium]|nr:mechanosensitive ion channel domain-containing protein [Spirochaetia bacterium]